MQLFTQVVLLGSFALSLTALAQTRASKDSPSLSPQQVFKKVAPSVFVVESLDLEGRVVSLGSGVAVAPDAVVTNLHVAGHDLDVRVRRGRKTWQAVVTHVNAQRDLCRLKVAGLSARAAQLRNSDTLAVGERVYAVGAPEGFELTLSEGLISGLREVEVGRVIQTTTPISRGSSGGGLFDPHGRLVGFTTLMVVEGQNLNFAAPTEWVSSLEEDPQLDPELDAFFELGAWFHVSGHLDKGEPKEAVQASRRFLRRSPDSAALWELLGDSYSRLAQEEKAIQAYREAIPLRPDFADLWFKLGLGYSRLGRRDRATEALREAVRLKPDYTDAWYTLGFNYFVQGDRSEAMEVYQVLRKLDPNRAREFFDKVIQP